MKRPVAARADHQQVGVRACLGEALGGISLDHDALCVGSVRIGKRAFELLPERLS